MKEKRIKIPFRPKGKWQKDDCINADCTNNSTLETFLVEGGTKVQIRCCDQLRCKRKAAWFARQAIQALRL